MTEPTVPAATYIGHVHLKVADLERAVRFYCDVMGFELVCHVGSAVFIEAFGYHHRIGLNTWESKDGQPSYWRGWYGATQADMPVLNKPLDLGSLLAELDEPPGADSAEFIRR